MKHFPRRCFCCRGWFLAWSDSWSELFSKHHHFYCSRDCAFTFLQTCARLQGKTVDQILFESGSNRQEWEAGWKT